MKLHPRHVPVEEARRELAGFLTDLANRRALTFCEILSLLARELNNRIGWVVEYERLEKKFPADANDRRKRK